MKPAAIGLALLLLVACKSFGADVQAVSPAIAPALTCIVDAVAAATVPSALTIEDAVAACGVAAADVDQVVTAIEQLAAAPVSSPLLKPSVAVKIRAMPHRAMPAAVNASWTCDHYVQGWL